MTAMLKRFDLSHVSRSSRAVVYALLLLVMGASITLSVVMERTASAIGRNAAPLLNQTIPQLRYLQDFESALLRYQLALDKRYNDSISPLRYAELENMGRAELDGNLEHLRRSLGDGPELAALYDGYQRITRLTPDFSRSVGHDSASARHVLILMNGEVKQLRTRLDAMQLRAEQAIYDHGSMASRNVAGITRLVHLFDVLALLTGLFMLYHVRARVRVEQALQHQAGHDPLTGLAHRRSFEARLAGLPAAPHAVVLGTIDRFSRIVGGHGHAFGDRMIIGLAQRMQRVAERNGGEVYRLDGANFAILYRCANDSIEFAAAIASLRAAVSTPYSCQGHEVYTTLSLGAANFPADGAAAETLLRNADAALQSARRAGGDTLVAYRQQLHVETGSRLDLEAQLRHAIERGELELHYQPQQALSSGALIGLEALVRWRRAGALVSPAEFIPLAEESGLIVQIGDWVLSEVCRQIGEWQALTGERFCVAVNISPRQFADPGFLARIEALLARTRIDPGCLELEITEGVMMDDAEGAIELLHQLRALGLMLAIDDFGTGYSSLAYLSRFPIHKLKIDQSFVRNMQTVPEQRAIVQATIGLGHSLGLTVIAEGVETDGQRAMLQGWQCDEIQGYWYSRPLASAAAQEFIDASLHLQAA
ncbi:MAG: putative bifunctional diguanylate cyclase/phosphodiesterase [Sphingomonadaceae bacterium]